MTTYGIGKYNVGRIAERIVANELEARGFRVSDLNKEGTSNNADLLAAKGGRTIQIQVKGSSFEGGWWFGYGHCTQQTIDKNREVFNSASGHYRADIIVLVCAKTPTEYQCLVLPLEIAEAAAQVCLDHSFRIENVDGTKKKPGKMWVADRVPKVRNADRLPLIKREIALVFPYLDRWDVFERLLEPLEEPYSDRYEHAGIEDEPTEPTMLAFVRSKAAELGLSSAEIEEFFPVR